MSEERMKISEVKSLFAVVQGAITNLNAGGCINNEGKRSLELACKFFSQEVEAEYQRQLPREASHD
jgi:hypothetical protein